MQGTVWLLFDQVLSRVLPLLYWYYIEDSVKNPFFGKTNNRYSSKNQRIIKKPDGVSRILQESFNYLTVEMRFERQHKQSSSMFPY